MDIQVNLYAVVITTLYAGAVSVIVGDLIGGFPPGISKLGILAALAANILYTQHCYCRMRTREVEAFAMGMGSMHQR